MTLTVEITRKPNGLLQARVAQDGTRGRNLLSKRSLSSVASAQIAAQSELWSLLRDGKVEVQFTGEAIDAGNRKAEDQRVSTPRDRYGWRSL